MLELQLDDVLGIAKIKLNGALRAEDFETFRSMIDAYIEEKGILPGVILEVASFHGWENFAALKAHASFYRSHYNKIARVALVSESAVFNALPALAEYFVQAEIRHFDSKNDAMEWILS
jgi:hypothetical protein